MYACQDLRSINSPETVRCETGQVPLYHQDPTPWQNAPRPRGDMLFHYQMEAKTPQNKDSR